MQSPSPRQSPVLPLLWLVLFAAAGWADEPGQLSESGRKERLRKIRGIVETLNVTVLTGDESQAARLLSEPSLLYADNVRELSDSSLWIWEQSGRPVGATAVEWHRSPTENGSWTFEFTGLTAQKLRLTLPDREWLIETTSGASRRLLNADPPASTRTQRALQMKRLSERFTAVELHRREGRVELRRLPSPVYRQAETAPGDAAIFVFANGTNPEVVLAISTNDATREWTYALGALCAEEVVVYLDNMEVWHEVLFTKPGARPAYINGRLPAASE